MAKASSLLLIGTAKPEHVERFLAQAGTSGTLLLAADRDRARLAPLGQCIRFFSGVPHWFNPGLLKTFLIFRPRRGKGCAYQARHRAKGRVEGTLANPYTLNQDASRLGIHDLPTSDDSSHIAMTTDRNQSGKVFSSKSRVFDDRPFSRVAQQSEFISSLRPASTPEDMTHFCSANTP